MATPEASLITYDVADHVATITFNRPEKRNAMTRAMLGDFAASVERASADDDAWVVIVTGSGGSFCAGFDLSDLSNEDAGQRGASSVPPWFLLRCTKPVIGAIDGVAVGMGAEFTSLCDVRIASTSARFAWNFTARGLVPDTGAGSWMLPRLIGPSRALRLLYSASSLDARSALDIGYVTEVVEPDSLTEAARREALAWTANAPFAMSRVRQLVYGGLERTVDEHLVAHRKLLAECFATSDHVEGVAAFLERRPPRFSGS
ncbi:MAG: enoyl-CoA hydratase/isomerase family protein [Acidimicrobiia bacterium]